MTARLQLSNPREPALAPMEVEALADTIPMENMDLVVKPGSRSVEVNPDSPNAASGICMRTA